MQRSKNITPSSERRASGRLRALSQKYKVSNETRTEIFTERRNARLESLEHDGTHYIDQKEEDEEYNPDGEGTSKDPSPSIE